MRKYFCGVMLMFSAFLLLVACATKSPTILSDAEQFKYEYESINNQKDDHGETMRVLEIQADNPIIYSSFTDILSRMNAKETFIVYFGFPQCPWCRSSIEALLSSADACKIETIYYVDIYTSRDLYVVENGKATKIKDGAEDYEELLTKLENILDGYVLFDDAENEISVGKKRIYAPNVIAVKDGCAVGLISDSNLLSDPYSKITPEIFLDMQKTYSDLFSLIQ